ncbi:hypothetical protein CPB86DRAFT_798285 [Serendipita vermifera]|nr:hypothetical protein CPB86DRAFT_798285 [Serendipita vermifera]
MPMQWPPPQEDIDRLITGLEHFRLSHYTWLSGAALLIYDYLLCLSDEVTYVWSSPLSLPITLYYIVRYLPIPWVVLNIYHLATTSANTTVLQWTPSSAPVAPPRPTRAPSPPITTTDHEANKTHTTHIDHSQKGPVSCDLTSSQPHTTIGVVSIPEPTHLTPTLQTKGPSQLSFSLDKSKSLLQSSFLRTGRRPISGILGSQGETAQTNRSLPPSVSLPLLRTLYMDGTIYFLVVFGMRLFTGLLLTVGPATLFYLTIFLEYALTSMSISRLFIHLRIVASETSELDLGNTSNAGRRQSRDDDDDGDDDFAERVSANISKSRVSTGRYDFDEAWGHSARHGKEPSHPLKALRYGKKHRRREYGTSFDELDGKAEEGGGGDWDYDDWKIRRLFSTSGSERSTSSLSVSKPSSSQCYFREWKRRRAEATSSSKGSRHQHSSRGIDSPSMCGFRRTKSRGGVGDSFEDAVDAASRANTPFTDRTSGKAVEVLDANRETEEGVEQKDRRPVPSPSENAKSDSRKGSGEKDNPADTILAIPYPTSARSDRKGKQKSGSIPLVVFSETLEKNRSNQR